jgi:hypothetical protein
MMADHDFLLVLLRFGAERLFPLGRMDARQSDFLLTVLNRADLPFSRCPQLGLLLCQQGG